MIVHYESRHNIDWEWVYNRANIDAAKVVWARDMGEFANRELLQYFRGRTIWIVDADSASPNPIPYSN